jgi:hypothetical protein
MSTRELSDEEMAAIEEVRGLDWFIIGDDMGFRGMLGGRPRQIIGKSRHELEALALKMARGEA